MNKEQVLAVLDEIGETHFITLLRAAIVALYEENERLRSAGQETIEVMDDIWETKNADDDFIYDEMGLQLSGAYFQLRAAIAAGSAQ